MFVCFILICSCIFRRYDIGWQLQRLFIDWSFEVGGQHRMITFFFFARRVCWSDHDDSDVIQSPIRRNARRNY